MKRRHFLEVLGLGAASLALPSLNSRYSGKPRLRIGYTSITWGYNADVLEPAVKSISELGYDSFETFGRVVEEWEDKYGGIGRLIDIYSIPIKSAFCMLNVLDRTKISEETHKLKTWASLLRKYGGEVIVFTGSGKRTSDYDYKKYRRVIAEATNIYASIVADHGLVLAYHQHTGTPVETRYELYDLMERVNTDIVKLGPDIGQLQKGGSDPVTVVKDFLNLIAHIHLKDYSGGQFWEGYCPLGQGDVDVPGVLNILEESDFTGSVMAELDYSRNSPLMPYEAARKSREYLEGLGYGFKGQ